MIANLMKEHAALRLLAQELERTLGPAVESGSDDCSRCDITSLQEKRAELARGLVAHEAKEKTLLDAAFRRGRDRVEELERELDASHQTLTDLMRLLRTVSTLYDGRRVYALRGAIRRVREEIDEHLKREERILFPLLNAASHRRHRRRGAQRAAARGRSPSG